MPLARKNIGLVSLAGMYLYCFKDDHAYGHMLTDPRAQELESDIFPPLWDLNDVNPADIYDTPGIGPFSIASMHFWQQSIPFEYIDVGAHVGMTVIAQAIFYKRCGKRNRVHAFEPGDVYDLLCRSVRASRVGDLVACVPAAASDSAGEVEFFFTPDQSPASSLLKQAVSRSNVTRTVSTVAQTITLDEYCADLRPDIGLLVKIDAEGADLKVLAGFAKSMRERPCVIQIEFFPSLMTYTDPMARMREIAQYFHMIEYDGETYRMLDADGLPALFTSLEQRSQPVTDIFLVAHSIRNAPELCRRLAQG